MASTWKSILNGETVLESRLLRKRELQQHEQSYLSKEDYRRQRAELNHTSFLPPVDSENTTASIHYIRKKFQMYCQQRGAGPWKRAIKPENCDKGFMMLFLDWICHNFLARKRKRGKKKSLNQYWRDFKMLYRRSNGLSVDANDGAEVLKYTDSVLKPKFALDVSCSVKPVAGPDDLLLCLVHHWSRDESVFPTEDDRLDVAMAFLFQAYTGCRPAELVEAKKSISNGNSSTVAYEHDCRSASSDDTSAEAEDDESENQKGQNEVVPRQLTSTSKLRGMGQSHERCKALCYEDMTLWICPNPKGGRDIFAMEVCFIHHKGADKKPKPTTFLFRENSLPILCPISHVIARAIRDEAVQVDGFKSAREFFATKVGKNTIVKWKSSMKNVPVFRRSIAHENGWTKSRTQPMKYSTLNFYTGRIGEGTGLEEKLTGYCWRRGTANAVDGVAPDAVRDQIMRHRPGGGVFANNYLNHNVRFNVQDAYLDNGVSDDGLIRAFTHMNIRCHPGAPTKVPESILEKLLAADTEICKLKQICQKSLTRIRSQYGTITAAPEKVQKEHQDLGHALNNARKSLKDDAKKEMRKHYFEEVHNRELTRQLRGGPVEESSTPVIKYQLLERAQLQSVLCDLTTELDQESIVARKVRAIDSMVALASKQEVATRSPVQQATVDIHILEESPDMEVEPPADLPLLCAKTQCIFCIGNERLPLKQRVREFRRVSHMMDHVENVHLSKHKRGHGIRCHHTKCKSDFQDVMQFKNHVQIVHGISLRSCV